MKVFKCYRCGYVFQVPYGVPKPPSCPNCGAPATFVHRVNPGPGVGRGPGVGGGPGRAAGRGPGRGAGRGRRGW